MPERSDLSGQNILLGITGGIAAYKTPMLVRQLVAAGANLQVVMSENAHRFVTSTTLQAVSGNPVRDDLWDPAAEAAMGHIELARWADQILIAPATANAIARLAAGDASNLLYTLCLASTAPISLAPAMNQQMFQHPAVQRNLATLTADGCRVIGPDSGDQACGDQGPGRMTEPEDLVLALAQPKQPGAESRGPLSGRTVIVTTGPTREAIDPVRYISNHSSGLQGMAIADAAKQAGANVILIAGPGVAESSPDMQRIDITSAQEMHAKVHEHLASADIFIGVAAVADYRPSNPEEQKIKRHLKTNEDVKLSLTENPDIIASVVKAKQAKVVVGFAAETHDTLQNARDKRVRKGLDAIVVNDVSDQSIGFNSRDNEVTLIHEGGDIHFGKQSKTAIAQRLMEQLVELFAAKIGL
ncbi:MAG: bifunctional phosphopantothenoylcysteine decarboxylase/phosphopantothenate--cysteine ligase CoaBC [Pseudomonadales bacterium]|nr:bifunctional phosphopantothenoylcysteine decarboxylase/phosphopantothenate--cysteine ligase CoaBC [Pseudomonadales bacterium]MBL6813703.1 bifunctional phosphopantothenoylcysteine decarboxylase/phosphopantothenate--cysteine ligase CoaBC [Pseudomonadales bacterium]